MSTSEDIELYRGSGVELSILKPPTQVLEEATQAAKALQAVIAGKPNKVVFNKEQYIEFEDWQTVGKFYNLSVKVRETHFVQFGDVMGWEATADVINTLTGQIVSSADAMCLNDEEKWSSKNKYEWHYCLKSGGTSKEDPGPSEIIWEDNPNKPGKKLPKKERVLIGEEKVPQFQLRSMAQTRACAKAFRNVLSWVIVLAGYKATPAEELAEAEHMANTPNPSPENAPIQQPQRKSETASPTPAASNANGDGPSCPKCQAPMKYKATGQWGPWWSCSTYPTCKGSVNDAKWQEAKAKQAHQPVMPDSEPPMSEREPGIEG